jgi:hypothetical protein
LLRGAVFAYGPQRDTNPWDIVASKVTMPVLAPRAVPFHLRSVRTVSTVCPHTQQVEARYSAPHGATLDIIEAKPFGCGNLGDPPLVGHPMIHGAVARLFENCAPAGCGRQSGDYALLWDERGIEALIFTTNVDAAELITIARSMSLVPV